MLIRSAHPCNRAQAGLVRNGTPVQIEGIVDYGFSAVSTLPVEPFSFAGVPSLNDGLFTSLARSHVV